MRAVYACEYLCSASVLGEREKEQLQMGREAYVDKVNTRKQALLQPSSELLSRGFEKTWVARIAAIDLGGCGRK
jgi:hypothetical protein